MPRRTISVSLLATVALLALSSAVARAQAPSCPPGNLLAGRKPSMWQDVRNNLALVTDEQVGQEGAVWDAPLAVVLETGASTLTYDLGEVVSLNALVAQADANDKYTIWGSIDGRDFKVLGRIDEVEGVHGLRTRQLGLGGVAARFLRFGEGVGDNFYSLSELQLFCQLPSPFPPKIKVVNAPVAVGATGPFAWWNDDTSRGWELILALMGFALLSWGASLAKDGRPKAHKRLRDRLLALLGVLAAMTYLNFFFFHFGNFIHTWDTFHYYVGSKYFKELSYDKLYECVAIADVEVGLKRRVELRKITNLRTNALETTADILAHPERCKNEFTPERWASFTKDVSWFRNRESAKRWDDTSTDHGYNATPVWNVAGTILANLAPASNTQILLLTLLDQAYYAGMIVIVWWAFGWRTTAVALLAFATYFPNRFYWTGGAYLRWDWLFHLVASVCLLKKGRPVLGGALLGYSTLLRIFPGFLFVGPIMAIVAHVVRATWPRATKPAASVSAGEPGDSAAAKAEPTAPAEPPTPRVSLREALTSPVLHPYYRFFVGGALAVALLVPVSFAVSGGPKSYLAFKHNTVKHKETPLTNTMGVRTVLAWRPNEAGRLLKNDQLTDPWIKWKEARLRAWREAQPLYYLIILGWLVLMALAARKGLEPWMAVAFGSTFICIGVELTCYYYAFIIVVALLYEKKPEVGRLLLLLTAFSEFVANQGNGLILPLKNIWLDEQYTLISFATLVGFAMILWWFGPGVDRAAAAAAREKADAKDDAGGDEDESSGSDDDEAAPPRTRKRRRPATAH